MSVRRMQGLIVALGLPAVVLMLLPYMELSEGLNRGDFNFYSIDEERRLGAEVTRQFEEQQQLITTLSVQAYLQELGNTIASVVGTSDFEFQFRVLEDKAFNALAFPGGFIYVTRGAVMEVQNEAELAGILAHEIAHVTARHATERLSRDQLIAFFTSLADLFLAGGASSLTDLVTSLEQLSYSRGDEIRSDELAVDYLYQAGYHPNAMASLFDRMWQSRQENYLAGFLSTHPLSSDRAAHVRGRISALAVNERWIRDSAAFHEVQATLAAGQGPPKSP